MKKIKEYLGLFFTMLKIGLFTFGGGYAMISLLQNEFVTRKGYLGDEEFLDLVTIAESTPGPIAINCSTYIGYKRHGFLGALVSTLGMCIPSFVIIYVISLFLNQFLSITLVAKAFRGIQVAVLYLILNAAMKMLRSMKKTPYSITILALTFTAMLLFTIFAVNFSAVLYILISALVGLVAYFLKQQKQGREEKK